MADTKPHMKVVISKKPQPPAAPPKPRGPRTPRSAAPGGHRKAIALAVAAVLVLVAGWHYFTIYRDISAARDDLVAVQETLTDVGFEAETSDIDSASRRLDRAESRVDNARLHLRLDPLIRIAGFLPRVGDQVDAADGLLDIAGTLIDLGQVATRIGASAVEVRQSRGEGAPPITRSLVDLLRDNRDEADQVRALAEKAARQRLELGDRPLWSPLDNARTRIDEELPGVVDGSRQLADASRVLPGFLGFEGERRYLVVALNSGELLPGGGLVTAVGVVPVVEGQQGQINFIDSTGWLPAAQALGVPYIQPPGPLQRYLLRDYSWNLLVSNWDPDFPTWAQQALQFFELTNGKQDPNGVIAVDLFVLEQLLTVTGPKTMDVPGRGPFTFTSQNAVFELERMTRPAYVPIDPGDDRKSIIGDLAALIIADMQGLPSEKWGDAIRVVRRLASERHIQVLSFSPAEQSLIREAGWDGRLLEHEGDYLHFNEASLLSTKLNLIIHPHGSLSVDITPLGDVDHDLRLTYTNPLADWAKDKDADLVEKLMLGGLYGGYLRVFGPSGMTNESVEVDARPAAIEDTGREETADWFGYLLPVAAGETHEVSFKWRSTPPGNATRTYSLLIQKQPGTLGMCLNLAIRRDGQPAKDIRVEGGATDANGRTCVTSDVTITATFDD